MAKTWRRKAVNMNIRILTRLTGTPELRAASASPPAAKIQLPKRVLVKSTWPKDDQADRPDDQHRDAVDHRLPSRVPRSKVIDQAASPSH
jgi:hypothetical protein